MFKRFGQILEEMNWFGITLFTPESEYWHVLELGEEGFRQLRKRTWILIFSVGIGGGFLVGVLLAATGLV